MQPRALPLLGWLPTIATVAKRRLQAISAASINLYTLTSFRVRVTLVHDA